MTTTNHTIKNAILEKIQKGDIVQRPRWQFVLKASMYYCAFVVVTLSTLYILSFVGLIARERGLFNILDLSPKGLQVMLTSLPWMIVLALLLTSAICYLLVRRYSFVYSRSILYGFGILFLAVVATTFGLYSFDPKGRIPCAGIEAGFPGVERLHMQMRPGTNPRPCRHHPVEDGMRREMNLRFGTSSERLPVYR